MFGAKIQGSQHFMKMKFPEFSLRKFQNSMRNTFPLMRLLGSQEVVLGQPPVIVWIHKSHYNQSVNEHMAQDAHIPNRWKPFLSGSLSQFPWVFPDWKIGNCFSRFSLISRVAGNTVNTVTLHSAPFSKIYDISPMITSMKSTHESALFKHSVVRLYIAALW